MANLENSTDRAPAKEGVATRPARKDSSLSDLRIDSRDSKPPESKMRPALDSYQENRLPTADSLPDTLPDLRGSDPKMETLVAELTSNRQALEEGRGGLKLRTHQLRVYNELISYLENPENGNTGYIKLPTGAGKTALFTSIAKASGLRALVIVPNKSLVGQTAREFGKFAPELAISSFYSDEKSLSGDAVITTYNSIRTLVERAKAEGEEFELVICDECHRSYSAKRQQAIKDVPGQLLRLGFSATPDASEQRTAAKNYGREIASMELTEAIRDGILSGVKVKTIITNADISDVGLTSTGELNTNDLDDKQKFFDSRIHAMGEILQKPENIGKSFVAYWSSVKQAEAAAEVLRDEYGINCVADTGGMVKAIRTDNQEKHREGEIQGIHCMKTLIEGWDSPRTELAFMCHPTMSTVDGEQRLGRVLRLFEEKEYATVYDFMDYGRKGVLASEVLGGLTELLPDKEDDDVIGEGVERETETEPEEYDLESGAKVVTTVAAIETYLQQNTAIPAIPKSVLSEILIENQFTPSSKLNGHTVRLNSANKDLYFPVDRVLEELGDYIPDLKGKTLDGEGAEAFASFCGSKFGWGKSEVDLYVEIRIEVETFDHQVDQAAILLQRLAKLDKIPSMGVFSSLQFRVSDPESAGSQIATQTISGRTILHYYGVTTGEDYLLLLTDYLYLDDEFDSLAERHKGLHLNGGHSETQLNEVQIRSVKDLFTPPQTATQMSKAREVARFALKLLDSADYKTVATSSSTININPSTTGRASVRDKHVDIVAFLEGFRDAHGIDAIPGRELLNEEMIKTLARAAAYPERAAQQIADVRKERLATQALAAGDILEELIREVAPHLPLVSERRFQDMKFKDLDGNEIAGSTVLEYYMNSDTEVSDYPSLLGHIYSREKRDMMLGTAREALPAALPQNLNNLTPQKFLAQSIELPGGVTITGEDAMALAGITERNRYGFSRFVLEINGDFPWYEDNDDTAFIEFIETFNELATRSADPSFGSKGALTPLGPVFSKLPANPISSLDKELRPKNIRELARLWKHVKGRQEIEAFGGANEAIEKSDTVTLQSRYRNPELLEMIREVPVKWSNRLKLG